MTTGACHVFPSKVDHLQLLLVVNSVALSEPLTDLFEANGHVVTKVCDGRKGLVQALQTRYDTVIAQVLLPSLSGLELCRSFRAQRDVPIVMISDSGGESDRIAALEAGADDCLTAPFSARELMARVHALVRRDRIASKTDQGVLHVGNLRLSLRERSATLAGRQLDLTPTEFMLLHAMAERAGRILTREHLLDLAKGNADEAFDRSIDAHISRLRQKLGDSARQPKLLKTVRRAGYLLAEHGTCEPFPSAGLQRQGLTDGAPSDEALHMYATRALA